MVKATFTLENHLDAEPTGGVRTALYRISQEALTNVKKHAEATIVSVELPEPVTDAGLKVAVVLPGNPLTVRFTLLLKPLRAPMVTV